MLSNISEAPESAHLLFKLLRERTVGISHKTMPDYKDHSNFVANHPYRAWFFVLADGEPIGSCYVKDDNSIGLNVEFENDEEALMVIKLLTMSLNPEPEIKSVRPSYFYINVSFDNIKLQRQLVAIGLNPIQLSFRV